jgi:hypothetical protein
MAYKVKKEKGTQFGILTPEGIVKNSMSIDISKVKSDDPLAYSYGYFQGKTGTPISKDKDLAPEYVRGYKVGKAEKEGKPTFKVKQAKAKKNKWKDEFVVQGNYGQGWEDVTSEGTHSEARQRLKEYNENETMYGHRLITRKVLNT